MKLHEAISKLIRENKGPMLASNIADNLNRNQWYKKRDGSKIKSGQINARVRQYPDLLEKRDQLIYIRNQLDYTQTDTSKSTFDEYETHNITHGLDFVQEKSDFDEYNPEKMQETMIPSQPGVYVFCLKSGSTIPNPGATFQTEKLNGLEVIYTGIASKSLRQRIANQHFYGNNAGRSTLRKSLGSLFGNRKVPRDKNPNSGKTKFSESDERSLTEWMANNLIAYYKLDSDPQSAETKLIELLNPPLNLSKNYNATNSEFRELLSRLRCN